MTPVPTVTIADYFAVQEMSIDQQSRWLDERWEAHAAYHGKQFGETWLMVPFDPDHNHRAGFCDPLRGTCADDSFDALVIACGADLGPADDDLPEPWEIAENTGPCLVEVCGPFGGDPEDGSWVCWDVHATASSPQLSEVA